MYSSGECYGVGKVVVKVGGMGGSKQRIINGNGLEADTRYYRQMTDQSKTPCSCDGTILFV